MKVDTSIEAMRILADELDLEPPGAARYAGRVLRQLADEHDEWRSAMLRILAEITGIVETSEERSVVRKITPPWERTRDGWAITGPGGARYEFTTRTPDGRNILHERNADASAAYGAALEIVLTWKSERNAAMERDAPDASPFEVIEGGKETDDDG